MKCKDIAKKMNVMWNATSSDEMEGYSKKMNMPCFTISIVLTKWKISSCIAIEKLGNKPQKLFGHVSSIRLTSNI